MDHISYNLLNLLTCVGPDVGTTSIGKHSNLKSLRKLLTFSPSNEGCLDILLDIPIIRGKSAQAEYHNIFRTYLQISFPMVLPSSLFFVLRLGSLRVSVVVNFLN